MMTNQEIFDKVVLHLRKQGKSSMLRMKVMDNKFSEVCAYRSLDGLRCAIGCLIPDEYYSLSMEGLNCGESLVFDTLVKVLDRKQDDCSFANMVDFRSLRWLLIGLQSIHDEHNVSEWEDCFQSMAQQGNLVYTPPTKEAIS